MVFQAQHRIHSADIRPAGDDQSFQLTPNHPGLQPAQDKVRDGKTARACNLPQRTGLRFRPDESLIVKAISAHPLSLGPDGWEARELSEVSRLGDSETLWKGEGGYLWGNLDFVAALGLDNFFKTKSERADEVDLIILMLIGY